MTTLLLSQRVSEENKQYSNILNAVDINNKEAGVVLYSQAISDSYKRVSEVISSVDLGKKDIRKKSMKAMMQESVFHGAGWLGQNFIA